jgi:hypothetical protein
MGTSGSNLNVKQLILVPALITLAVTIVRLVGELAGGPSSLFNRAAGGGGALIGIVWLIPIFGVYFAARLVRAGFGPESAGKVIGFAVLGLVVAGVTFASVPALSRYLAENASVSRMISRPLGTTIGYLLAIVMLHRAGWPAFFKTLLGYAFAARIPVLIVMFIAMLGNWGTHYELGPPGTPEMSFLAKFVVIAVVPQMTFWIMVTMVFGTLFGGVAAAVLRPKASTDTANP